MYRIRTTAFVAALTGITLAVAGCGSSTPAVSSAGSALSSAAGNVASAVSSGASAVSSGASSVSSAVSSGASSVSSAASSGASSVAGGGDLTGQTLVIGSANFNENVILADIYAGALKAKGATVTTKPNIGAREVYLKALKEGSIDLVPEYSGTLLDYFDQKATAVSSADVYAALPAAIGSDLKVLQQSTAEDKDSINVSADTAKKYNLKTIADLKDKAGDLTLGAPAEFETRKDGVPGLKAKYGVVFGDFKSLDPNVTVAALKNNQVDAADLFTTDPQIKANNFVTLEDPENLYNAQNVLPLINAKKSTPGVEAVLNAVSAKLTTETLSELVGKAGAGTDPATVAGDWLKSNNLG